jgi:glycine cleavage system H protein
MKTLYLALLPHNPNRRIQKMNIPTNLKYTKSDEWVLVEGDIVTIGITDYAQDQLSDIVYIEYLVDVDDETDKDGSVATIESVKAASDVLSPVSGKVVEVNEDLPDAPESINTEPYDAWMVKVEVDDKSGLDDLMDAKAYEKYCEEREH